MQLEGVYPKIELEPLPAMYTLRLSLLISTDWTERSGMFLLPSRIVGSLKSII